MAFRLQTYKIIIILIFIATHVSANEKWIPLKPIEEKSSPKKEKKINIDLSQIQPINKMMKKVTIIKQLIDASSKKEKVVTNDKKWFALKDKKK
jgi:hypothetical protein